MPAPSSALLPAEPFGSPSAAPDQDAARSDEHAPFKLLDEAAEWEAFSRPLPARDAPSATKNET